MPVYERRAADGTVLERTVTLDPARDGSGYDEQMAALAADGIPWHRVDDIPLDDHQVVTALATGQFPATPPTVSPSFAHDDLKTEEV